MFGNECYKRLLSDEQAEEIRTIHENPHSKMIEYSNEGSQRMHTEFDAMVEEGVCVLDKLKTERWRGHP